MVSPCSPGLVSLCVPSYFPILDGVSAFLKPCLPSYFPLLDGASAFPRSCPPCPPLVLPCFPLSSRMCAPYVYRSCVTAFPRSCLPLSLFFSPHMCLCWMVRPPSRGLASACLHSLRFCVPVFGWYDPVSPIVFPIYIIYIYVLAFDFRGLASACLPLSAHNCACPGWCCRFPEVLSRMVFLLVSLCWMVCPLSRLVSPCFLCLPLSHCFQLSVIVL